jgi:hypothetical protein
MNGANARRRHDDTAPRSKSGGRGPSPSLPLTPPPPFSFPRARRRRRRAFGRRAFRTDRPAHRAVLDRRGASQHSAGASIVAARRASSAMHNGEGGRSSPSCHRPSLTCRPLLVRCLVKRLYWHWPSRDRCNGGHRGIRTFQLSHPTSPCCPSPRRV